MASNRSNQRPPNLVRRTPMPSSASVAVGTPLQPAVVYASPDADALDDQYEGRASGYTYAREGHPNADVVAAKIDALEASPTPGIMLGSGMGAISAVFLGLLKAGDHIVAGDQLYGRSLRLLTQDLPRFGIECTFVDAGDAANVAAAMRPETKLVMVEVVSNPTLRIADLDGIAAITAHHQALLMMDNTFTTPRAIRAYDHGADIVIHSVTKLLAGHSDVTLGYASVADPGLRQPIVDAAVTWGLTPSPWDCWMAERGMHSFDLRFDRAQQTAGQIADRLAGLAGVEGRDLSGPRRPPGRGKGPSPARSKSGQYGQFSDQRRTGTGQRLHSCRRGNPVCPNLGRYRHDPLAPGVQLPSRSDGSRKSRIGY